MSGEIFIADKATLDSIKVDTDLIKGYVDSVETTLGTVNTNVNTANTKLGTNADAAGTTSVFARLKQIYDYLVANLSTTRAAKIDNLDATISTRATATALTTVDGKIGVANPTTADATTVMNYLKKLDNNTSVEQLPMPTKPKQYAGQINYYSPVKGTWQPLVTVSGRGIISRLTIALSHNIQISTAKYRLVVDGVAHEFPLISQYGGNPYYAVTFNYVSNAFTARHDLILKTYFNSSFSLEFYTNDDISYYSASPCAVVDYSLV